MSRRSSILLPVFNGARFLDEQVDSILGQTDGDFELIAVDDGSDDDSAAMLARHAARDPRVRVLPSAGNLGHSARLAQLFGEARGAFVMIADQDDIWDTRRNERLLAAIGDRALAFGRSELVDAAGTPLGFTLLQSLGLTADPESRARTLFRPLASAHGAVMRRDSVDRAIFGHPLPFDWLMSALALFGGGVAYADDAVVRHRMHGGNQMNSAAPDTARMLGALRNRLNFLARRPAQLRLWLMLDFLGRSRLDPELRRTFGRLAAATRRTWFGVPAWRLSDTALREALTEALRPLAGSDDDWAAASTAIDDATRSAAHPAKLAAALRAIRA